MCGIAGMALKSGKTPGEGVLRGMAAAIAHRGPEGEGIWSAPGIGLAHRRLAIIDLSPSGAQPRRKEGLAISFNGEIYNYRELREELRAQGAPFVSETDTEVILEAFRAWGVDSFARLRGMFAFALWNEVTNELFLVRDKIGKKPLFFGFSSAQDLVFASELKAFSGVLPMKPDLAALRLFLGLQYVPSPLTGFEGISQLEPGTYGEWSSSGWKVSRYHAWDFSSPKTIEGKDAEEGIRAGLDEAVRIRQLAADVPVGAFLSGGIDSAAVVAFASRHVSQPLQTFTMGFEEARMDERREAASLARHFQTEHHEFLAKPEDLLAFTDELVSHYDAPYADSSAFPLWLLARETAKKVKVVLTGDGGDELFGGYRRYAAFESALNVFASPLVPSSVFPHLVSTWGSVFGDVRFERMAETVDALNLRPETAYGELFCGSYFATRGLGKICQPEFLERTRSSDAVSFIAAQMAGETSLDAAMRFDLLSYLPDDLNVKMDRATMRFGLEARAPFLDQQMVSLALRIPLKEKVSRGKTKVVLKRALKGVVPDEVLERAKKGFQVPLMEWFQGPLREPFEERCLDASSSFARIVRVEEAKRLLEENARGRDHGNRLWMLFSLATWLNRFSS